MAFRKSRRLRRNLRKSRKNRNRSRYYRGGDIYEEQAGEIFGKYSINDSSYESNIIQEIKTKYPDNSPNFQENRAKLAGNIIFMLGKQDRKRFQSIINIRDF